MPNDHRGRNVHGGKVTDDEEYSFSVDDILGAFDPYQESKLRTLGYEQDETFRSTGTEKVFSNKEMGGINSTVIVPDLPPGGDWPVVHSETRHDRLFESPDVTSTHSLGRLPDGRLPDPPSLLSRSTSGGTMGFWDVFPGVIGSNGIYRTPYRAALAAKAMSKRAADPTRNLRTGRRRDNV
jgi:hypothetical protein